MKKLHRSVQNSNILGANITHNNVVGGGGGGGDEPLLQVCKIVTMLNLVNAECISDLKQHQLQRYM